MRCLIPGAVTVLIVSSAFANQLDNGGFESPALSPNSYNNISPGGEPVGFAWTVVSGNIDHAYLPLPTFTINFNAYELNQLIDLNGLQSGTIRQLFATVPGQLYALSFAYCDNPNAGGVSTADISVQDVGTSNSLLSHSVSHSTSTSTTPDYALYFQSFTAQGVLTGLTFSSTSADTGASGGIFLDAVDVSPVPEPASLPLLAVAAPVLARRTRRK